VLVETAALFSRSRTEVEIAGRLVIAVQTAPGADEVAVYLLADNVSFT
jgi:hypothetical protein